MSASAWAGAHPLADPIGAQPTQRRQPTPRRQKAQPAGGRGPVPGAGDLSVAPPPVGCQGSHERGDRGSHSQQPVGWPNCKAVNPRWAVRYNGRTDATISLEMSVTRLVMPSSATLRSTIRPRHDRRDRAPTPVSSAGGAGCAEPHTSACLSLRATRNPVGGCADRTAVDRSARVTSNQVPPTPVSFGHPNQTGRPQHAVGVANRPTESFRV